MSQAMTYIYIYIEREREQELARKKKQKIGSETEKSEVLLNCWWVDGRCDGGGSEKQAG